MLVMVLASMEQTITSTAMPTIIGELHGLEVYSWVASLYLLCCTISMPLYGRLADTLGRKRVLLTSIGIFLVASLGGSTARSMTQLILWRGLQGIGAGGIMPTVLTLLGDIFTLKERARIQGLFSAIWGTSALAGPALGALLVKTLGWRSIFFVNIPPGIISAVVLAFFYHEHKADLPQQQKRKHVDLPGFISLSITSAALLVAVSLPVSFYLTASLVLIFAAAAIYFVRHERRAEDPILPLDLLRQPTIWPCLIGSLLLGIGFLSLDTYVPLYVQGGRGGDATSAASVVTPVMLAWAISGIFAAHLVVRWGFRNTSVLGSSIVCVGFSGLILCTIFRVPMPVLTAVLALTGFGLGPASMSYLLSAQNAVDWAQRGTVTGSIQLARTLGGAMGIGLLGALFNLHSRGMLAHMRDLGYAPASILQPDTHHHLPLDILREAQGTISASLIWVFVGMLIFAVFQLIVSLRMPKLSCDHRPSASEAMEAMAG